MSYEVRLLSRAEKQLESLDSLPYQSVKKHIYSLRDNPRPADCRKLTNQPGWRVRAGDYRIVYEIFSNTRYNHPGVALCDHLQSFVHAFLLLSFTCAPKLPSNNLTDTKSPVETESTERMTLPAASVAMA
jgi:mRNA interferase RelE/StbE